MDVLIIIEVDIFLLESSDEAFGIPVLQGRPRVRPKSQRHAASAVRYSPLKDTARLDRNDGSLEPVV